MIVKEVSLIQEAIFPCLPIYTPTMLTGLEVHERLLDLIPLWIISLGLGYTYLLDKFNNTHYHHKNKMNCVHYLKTNFGILVFISYIYILSN